jgi:hypothetical protein
MSKRSDAIGFFWQDHAKVKPPKKEKIRRPIPQRFWESPDYLPFLEEARAYKPDLFTDMELWQASINKERLLYDIEVYPNYCMFGFKSIQSAKVIYFELYLDPFAYANAGFDIAKFKWVLENFCIVNFNGRKYDFPITTLALAGYDCEDMWDATQMIIEQQLQSQDVYKKYKTKRLEIDQIDLIELTALAPGLKVCAGRLHAPRLQDLPFKPGTILTDDQIIILRWYNINDLDNTKILYDDKLPQIQLREEQGKKYKIDLRSHSDAQMAEAIISAEIKRKTGRKFLNRTKLPIGTWYRYQTPRFIKYESALMNHILKLVQNATFFVDPNHGNVIMPPEMDDLVINIANGKYKFGIGGLHSQEKSIAHIADDDYFIADTDVTSYYPNLILNAGLTPENLGKDFILVYNSIVVERISAKKAGEIITAECLKIVANGTFGKLGSMWSIMYAPNLLIQVTVTGQLSILMLVERFELNGIEVTSVNTDGIVVKCLRSKEQLFNSIVKGWEKDTGLSTEEIRYKATYSKDINNYIAIYEVPQKGKLFKLKGAYGETAPKKNAVNEVCIEAVKEMMATQTPPAITIQACKDIRKFTTMRAVSGGAIKDDLYLGKLIRWYHALNVEGEIIYAKTGNKVALTDNCRPCMNLPKEFPEDIDYEYYIQESYRILEDIGYSKPTKDLK